MPSASDPSRSRSPGRWTDYGGFAFDAFDPDSAWIRESAWVGLPPLPEIRTLRLVGEMRVHPDADAGVFPTLSCRVNGRMIAELRPAGPGPWELEVSLPPDSARRPTRIELELGRVGWTNTLAWLGRVTGAARWQRFRTQGRNRQLRISRIETAEGEPIYDFSHRMAPYVPAFARRHRPLGLNVVGFLTADLGIGESARCMVRAADAVGLATALLPLKLNCRNRLGDETYSDRLRDDPVHPVNVFHVDPPVVQEIDLAHGPSLRSGRRNVAYWAWELPEFPDAWVYAFDYFHEVWCPSDFTRQAIMAKSPVPVLTLPHAVAFERPANVDAARFRIPADTYRFLFLFDLNSYSDRKNPEAVIEAFRRSGLAGQGAVLVIKVQNADGNPADFERLQARVADLPGTVLISETLSRADTYALEAACDSFVSLHRAEGFGLAVAECMYLGKPVIATDWSATAEYLNAGNGCPVRCEPRPLTQNIGPYAKGMTWAEPEIDHAAEWMQRLHGDRALGSRLGQAARETIESRFSPAVIGAAYRRRLEAIAAF